MVLFNFVSRALLAFRAYALSITPVTLRLCTALVCVLSTTIAPALADPNVFGGSATVGRNFIGFAINAFLIIVLSLGGVAIIMGLIGQWKDPRHKDAWGHAIEGGLSAVVICGIGLAFFNAGPAMASAIQQANSNP